MALTPAAAIILILLVFLVNARLARFHNDLAPEAQRIARQWAPAIERALRYNDRAMLGRIAQAAVQSKRIARLRVFGRQGQILVDLRQHKTVDRLGMLANHLLRVLPAGERLRPSTAVLPLYSSTYATSSLRAMPAAPLGMLEIELPLTNAARTQLEGLLLPGLLALAVLFYAGLLALLTAGTILAPIRRLTHQIRKLEPDSLQSWAPIGCHGQLGQLETAVETLVATLRQHQYRLEERIRCTASELRQTLRALEVQNAELDVARQRALEASKIKSQFLANVSHEIRTPINGIVGFTELLRHSPLDAEQRDHVDTIKVSCANLLTIINDILDFSKIEAGKLEIDSTVFDICDSVEEVVTLLAPAAYSKGLELVQLNYADVPARLNGDPTRIRQILTNLLHNAIKFTEQGRIVVRVILEEESPIDVTLRITINDTGIGLSEEDRSKLFRAFSQAGGSSVDHCSGTGLGLIISKKLVEQMGGSIGFESEPQQGSTFWFALPLQKQPGTAPITAIERAPPLAGRSFLMLDDEPLSQRATQNLLASWGANVTLAENEAVALDRLDRNGPWDAAILSVARKALHKELPQGLVSRCRDAAVPLLILASTVDRAQLRKFYKNGAGAALPRASRRQTILRELCQLIGTPNPLPSRTPHRDAAALAHDTTAPRATPPARVLVVDDNAINRKLVRSIMTQQGAWVDEACDGFEALARCQERNYDIIFMDILMPGLGGEEAAQRIHELYPRERIPKIVALTASAIPGERERLLAGGMDECLIKPITEKQVADCLSSWRADPRGADNCAVTSRGGPAARGDLLEAELKQMLRAELPEHRQRIRNAYRSDDMARLREQVHRLHGAASICRLPPLQWACRNLEEALIKGKRHAIIGGMKRLLTEIDKQRDSDHRPPSARLV
ncbi:MAG: response regulator [Nitrococcus mobilis]|nr:response regulator [Nitrococcus mobilis]